MQFFKKDTTAKVLLLGYIILFIWAAINPYDRADWWAEDIPIMGIVVALIIMYVKGIRLSALSYVFMSVLVYMHTIGGHYTFERVPFDWFTDFFGFQRNHYDRIAHFTVGFYAYPFCELLVMKKSINSRLVLFLYPVFAIAFIAMTYELIEWIFAVTNGGSAGINFLGSQGDVWDAQKDMLADTLGGIFATILYFWCKKPKLKQ